MDDQRLDQMRKDIWDWLESHPPYHAQTYDRALALEQVVALHEMNKKLDRIIDLLQAKFGYPPVD